MNLKELYQSQGQSIWQDDIHRSQLKSAAFEKAVREGGLRGVTTNPSIFEKAIDGSDDYKQAITELCAQPGATAESIYEQLAIEDIRMAADIMSSLYKESERGDGYISMEVPPALSHDTKGTVAEGLRLWEKVGRENLMIKVPGTPEGMPAIHQLIAKGVNVNVTLLFSRIACRQAVEAYFGGLEDFAAQGGDLRRIASVASLFVSRMDVKVDGLLHALIEAAPLPKQAALQVLLGKVAIANAKLAYQDWQELHQTPRWKALSVKGARPQRLLWASTSVKDKAYDTLMYAESLMGPATVDTLPPGTLKELLKRGHAAPRLMEGLDDARKVLDSLKLLDISIDSVCQALLEEGLAGFEKSFNALMAAIERQRVGLASR